MATLEKVPTNGGTYLEPFTAMTTWRRFMDSLFEPMTAPPAMFGTFEQQPLANVYEKEGVYTIEFAVPGYKRDEIDVEVKANHVTISGKYSKEKADEQKTYRRREMRQGSFSRTIAFPEDINHDSVKAALEDGVLKVTVQPIKPVAAKKIPITTG